MRTARFSCHLGGVLLEDVCWGSVCLREVSAQGDVCLAGVYRGGVHHPIPPVKYRAPNFMKASNTQANRRTLHNHGQWRIQDFPEEGAPTPQGEAPTYDFAKFSQKLHEIERISTPRGGGRPSRPSLDPPLTVNHKYGLLMLQSSDCAKNLFLPLIVLEQPYRI